MQGLVERELMGRVRPASGLPGFAELPCMALLVRDGCIMARNELASQMAGVAIGVALDKVLLGALDLAGDMHRQRFDCMMLRAEQVPLQVSVAVCEATVDGEACHLVMLMERWEGFGATMSGEATFLEEVLDATVEATVITHEGRVLHVNREFTNLFGYTRLDCVGRELDELVLPDGRLHESEMLLHSVREQGRTAIDTIRRTGKGELIDVSVLISRVRLGGEATGLFVTYRDIRVQKREEARLQHTALHDGLTGLANRALFLDRVRLTMARLKRRPDRGFAIIFLDLDGFKKVNDTLGHAAGDALLLCVAERLQRAIRPQDTVARFGGDEFALLLDESGTEEDVAQVATRIQAELQRPIQIEGAEARVAGSMGIAMATVDYDEAERILLHADTAMYAAKAGGKGRHVVYRKDLQAAA